MAQLPHWMQMSGLQTGTMSEMFRFSHREVPEGYVPSAGIALTGRSSPRPAIITAVTSFTNGGASAGTSGNRLSRARRCRRKRDLVEVLERAINRGEVPLDELRSLSAVGRDDGVLDSGDGLVAREHARDREEAGLHDRIDAARHAGFDGDPVGIDHEEPDAFANQILLHRRGAARPRLASGPNGTVDEEHRAVRRLAQQVDPIEELKLMAGDELRALHEVGGTDRPRTEPEVRRRPRPGLLRVVDEEALRVARPCPRR